MSWWERVTGRELAQGDLLPDCNLPAFVQLAPTSEGELSDIEVESGRLIVVTQSCDLVNGKAKFVALCAIHRLDEYEAVYPAFRQKGSWEAVRKGRLDALHLLASPESPDDNRDSFVVDFGQIVSLPVDYLINHAEELGDRWRLKSPFLEHFSQGFARFFMRVGLPRGIAPFK